MWLNGKGNLRPQESSGSRKRMGRTGPSALVGVALLGVALVGHVGEAANTKTVTYTMSKSKSRSLSTSKSASVSLSLPTGSMSYSLPSGTASSSLSLPTGSMSFSLPSGTASFSGSLSKSKSASVSLSLPTGTASASGSLSKSLSLSTSLTQSLSKTVSLTHSLGSYNNYTMGMYHGATLREGDEFRVRVQTVLQTPDGTKRVEYALNSTAAAQFDVRMYTWDSTKDIRCEYTSATPLAQTTEYGMSMADSAAGDRFVSSAHATFVAPPSTTTFVVCFKHVLDSRLFDKETQAEFGQWKMLVLGNGEYKFTPQAAKLWYYLPDATLGQYAVVQLLSAQANFNFTYAPSGCATAEFKCADGDNLKIVKQGDPCTYEYQTFGLPYYGTNYVDAAGTWQGEGTRGLLEGATAGGVGVFGTPYANPLVDSWSSSGTYYAQNSTVTPMWSEAMVYVRLPQTAAKYDICYSSRQERAEVSNLNSTNATAPVWRKLYRCTSPSACASNSANLYFTAVVEPVGWSMVDMTPGTWGEIVFDDSGTGALNNLPASSTVAVSAPQASGADPMVMTTSANYWAPSGGDYFRIVAAASLAEAQTDGRAHPWPTAAKTGSQPLAGCWSRALDTASSSSQGGFVEEEAPYPIGSRNLVGDPTASGVADATSGVAVTVSTLYVPATRYSQWYVCYRKTCTYSGATCTKNSGMRVLPFHKGGTGSLPVRWTHLNDSYLPGTTSTAAHPLVPDYIVNQDAAGAPAYPAWATWYMNDTRTGTWGPLVVETVNATAPMGVDTRAWNFGRTYATGDRVGQTVGSVLRLVQAGKPCDYASFRPIPSVGAENKDGGMVECNNAGAETDKTACAGSMSDVAASSNAAYYITVPDITNYIVCHRNRFFNWVALSPSGTTGAWNDKTKPMPDSVLERGAWVSPSSYFTPTTSALTSLSLSAVEMRAGMEALFLVTDATVSLQVGPRKACAGGCPASGDVLRLVAANKNCDINPYNWNMGKLADAHLSLICNVTGAGSIAQSGLYYDSASVRACALAGPTQTMCQNATCNSTEPHLAELAAKTPDIYDDIVPHDHTYTGGHATVAAVVVMPPHITTSNGPNFYKVCYKQAGMDNWAVFNETWEVKPAPAMKVSPARISEVLLGGELKRFRVQLTTGTLAVTDNNGTITADFSLYAKLVPFSTMEQNRYCQNQAGSSEGEIYSAATSKFNLLTDGANNTVDFYLTVPHTPGNYSLCVQLRQSSEDWMSWWRPGSADANAYDYKVIDNGVRWYVTPGNQPTNQGLSKVQFLRCAPTVNHTCSPAASQDVFDTNPGKDAAKIVAVGSACHDGSTNLTQWGTSVHVWTEPGATASALGMTDLGPADGPSDVAELRTVLPAATNDARTQYKVCIRTVFLQGGLGGTALKARWVEVQEAQGLSGQHLVQAATGRAGFRTEMGLVKSWTLNAALRPAVSLYSSEAKADATALAGVSTQYVADVTAATATATDGFVFNTYSSTASNTELQAQNIFKLVLSKTPVGRLPKDPSTEATWGTLSNWAGSGVGVDCMSPAAVSNVGTCTDNDTTSGTPFCPYLASTTSGTSIGAYFHIPLNPGSYQVCYKVNHTSLTVANPWLRLASSSEGDYLLHSHPAFLEMIVGSAQANMSVFDLRTMESTWDTTGEQVSVSSWCGTSSGVNCTALNGASGFTTDLVTIANDTQVCPTPSTVAGSATGAPEWFQLVRTTNASAMVADTWGTTTASAFALPPALYPATSGQYKICVFKAGEATATAMGNASAKQVTKKGVVYQLYNRGLKKYGGGSGYWRDSNIPPSQLTVTSTLAFNSSLRFMQFTTATTLETLYGASAVSAASVTDATTGMVSRTPLLTSGAVVVYDVQVATKDKLPVPFGSFPLVVKRCAQATAFAGLECVAASQVDPSVSPGPFTVWAIGGACKQANATQYGWERNGLRQFTQSGQVRLSLQYRSACPAGEFGCGVRFEATTQSGVQLLSPAQWVNVAAKAPNGVALDGNEPNTAFKGTAMKTTGCATTGVTTCYLKKCVHGLPCTLSLQARRDGPSEFAANGTVQVLYAQDDYGANYSASAAPPQVATALGSTVGSQPLLPAEVWGLGGTASYTFTPKLKDGALASTTVYLNVTYQGVTTGGAVHLSWTRFVVEVSRAVLAAVDPVRVDPWDVAGGLAATRSPSPAFIGTMTAATASVAGSITAVSGSYLEALVPYQLTYVPRDASLKALPKVWGALSGWKVTATVGTATTDNMVLYSRYPDETFVTAPQILSKAALMETIGNAFSFAFVFRVYVVDNACSRFSSAGGCTLVFTFSDGTNTVKANVVTPVRVPASTVEVTPAAASGTVREGISVAVRPGSYIAAPSTGAQTFVYDDFHYGEVFALLDGPGPTDGASNRDKLRMTPDAANWVAGQCAYSSPSGKGCLVEKYPTKTLAAAASVAGATGSWGAQWTMRPHVPCNRCAFTFHTTWGAGPDSSEYAADGTQRGTTTLTWTEEAVTLECSSAAVQITTGAVMSDEFALTVSAGVTGMTGTNAVYPRWWVMTNSNTSVTPAGVYPLYKVGETKTAWWSQMGARANMGTAVANFSRLYFDNTTVPALGATADVKVVFSAVGIRYASGAQAAAGSRPTGTSAYTCTSAVTLSQREAAVAAAVTTTTSIQLVSVGGGVTSLCASSATGVCTEYTATVSEFGAGITVDVKFVNTSSTGTVVDDTSSRNVTVAQAGGAGSSPSGAPAWTYGTEVWTSGTIVLDSAYNPSSLETIGTNTYTYGNLTVVATRTQPDAAVLAVAPQGAGSVTLKYSGTGAPARKAMFKVCEAAWDGSAEVMSTVANRCVTISLWITPTTQTRATVYAVEPASQSFVHGTTSACGAATTATFTVASYFTVGTSTTLRYWAYDSQLGYTLTAGTQYLLESGATTAAASLMKNNSVTRGAAITHTVATTGLKVSFTFYGRDKVTTNTTASVAGAVQSDVGGTITAVATTAQYMWVSATETLSKWEVNTTVSVDDECPTKRRLQTSTSNYRTYGTGVPGAGWSYASGGAVAGLPFPIQTVVRTTSGARAWSFTKDILVRVAKRSWTGCNDGGTLKVYDLAGSLASETTRLVEGTVKTTTWVESATAAVSTRGGVAVPWSVLSTECEACTLQLDLCYGGKTAATCLDGLGVGSTDPSDALPIFADRSKLSKPFSVKAPRMDVMEVYDQTLPDSTSAIRVGDMFAVKVENVQRFAGVWAMNEPSTSGWTREVWVRSVWMGESGATLAQMRYGNGGFVHDGAARAAAAGGSAPPSGCNAAVSAAEFAAAADRVTLSGASSGSLNFFFARPCGRCQVWLDYRLTPPAALVGRHMAVRSSFPLRAYTAAVAVPGSALVYTVQTCGMAWLLGGVPLTAVRRRKPFSVGAVRVDAHNIPAWEGTTSAAFARQGGAGNGAGVAAVVTSPVSSPGGSSVNAVGGSATVRAFFLRACYQCSVSFAGKASPLTVLTDATQIIAVPAFHYERYMLRKMTAAGAKASWMFDVYAADDLGDRAYAVGGPPTEYALQRMYQTRAANHRAAASMSASGKLPSDPTALLNGSAVTVTYGSTSGLRLTEGTKVYNGIPMPVVEKTTPVGAAGQATVEVSKAAMQLSLSFVVTGAAGVPTGFFGEKKAPMVHFSVEAGAMAVDTLPSASSSSRSSAGGAACTADRVVGEGYCTFNAYAIGQAPGAQTASDKWYVSAVRGVSTATVTCGSCGTAWVSPNATYMGGVATFKLGLTGLTAGTTAACSCDVVVTSPASLVNGTSQTFKVAYTDTSLADWKWASSQTLEVPATTTGKAYSVYNRTVHVGLAAWDTTGKFRGIGGVSWAAGASVTAVPTEMVPEGCFACASGTTTCAIANTKDPKTGAAGTGDAIEIAGVFAAVGTCQLKAGAFTGFPTGTTAPTTAVTFTVEAPVGLMIAGAPNEGSVLSRPNFTRLWGRTLSGAPAAVTGVGSSLSFQVVDAKGMPVVGDNHMQFTLTGTQKSNTSTTTVTWTGVARRGVGTFQIRSNQTTRTAACEAWRPQIAADHEATAQQVAVSGMPACEHVPWFFTVQAVAPMTTSGPTPFAAIADVGPLHFVRRAVRLAAFARIGVPCVPPMDMTGVNSSNANSNSTNSSKVWKPMKPICPTPPAGLPTAHLMLVKQVMKGWVPLGLGGMGAKNGRDSHMGRPWSKPHPATWGRGYNFTMKVVALGLDGIQVKHPEDKGSAAPVQLRPLAVPCSNVDKSKSGKWVLDTCVDGKGTSGACGWGKKIASLPKCMPKESSGWNVPAFSFKLKGGEATFKDISYGKMAGWKQSGLTRFYLSTTQLNYKYGKGDVSTNPAATFAKPDDTFLFEVNMQDAAALRPGGNHWMCSGTACKSTTYYPEPGKPFALMLSVVDVMGDAVRSDSNSSVKVSGVCLDKVHNSYFAHAKPNALDFINKPTYSFQGGWTQLTQLYVTEPCAQMQLTVVCTSGVSDQMKLCTGNMVTLEFPVDYPASSGNVTRAPTPPPEVITLSGLSLAAFDTEALAMPFVNNVRKGDAEIQMLKLLKKGNPVIKAAFLKWVCAKLGGGGITAADKISGRCVDKTITAAPPTLPPTAAPCNITADPNCTGIATVAGGAGAAAYRSFFALATTVDVVTEFEIETAVTVDAAAVSTAVKDAIVADLADPNSILKQSPTPGVTSPFATASTSNMQVGVANTPVPPPPPTPAPPTNVPPTTSQPTSMSPPTPQPPVVPTAPPTAAPPTSVPPVTFDPNIIPIPTSGGVLVPTLWVTLCVAVLALFAL